MKTAINLLLGVAIGDALGVPYEFSSRAEMEANPAKDMVGFKVHNQPPGTWSDDSSLTFCLAEALANGYNLKETAINFIKWKNEAYWTARNEVFDIGMTTSRSISRLEKILIDGDVDALKTLKYGAKEQDNGNGALMRILPFVFEIKGKDIKTQFELIWENAALTHRHIRSAMCCMIYLNMAEHLIAGLEPAAAYQKNRSDISNLWEIIDFAKEERKHFQRVIQNDIRTAPQSSILSGGYVIESLECSLWSFLNTTSYESAVLTSINFGHDTDTSAAITGGLAGLYYKEENIPDYWIVSLARMDDIYDLAKRLENYYLDSI